MPLLNDVTILGDANEDNAVEKALNDFVQLLGCEARIVFVNVLRKFLAPTGHFIEESGIDRYAEALRPPVPRQHGLKRPGQYPFLREFPKLFQACDVVAISDF